jgi:hypothetical protein
MRERAKVHLIGDAALAARLPARDAIVEVVLTDGRRFSQTVQTVRGTAANPMSRQEVVDKVRDLTAPVLGPVAAGSLIEAVLSLETLGDVRALRHVQITVLPKRSATLEAEHSHDQMWYGSAHNYLTGEASSGLSAGADEVQETMV